MSGFVPAFGRRQRRSNRALRRPASEKNAKARNRGGGWYGGRRADEETKQQETNFASYRFSVRAGAARGARVCHPFNRQIAAFGTLAKAIRPVGFHVYPAAW
jgi:hypothetical protein